MSQYAIVVPITLTIAASLPFELALLLRIRSTADEAFRTAAPYLRQGGRGPAWPSAAHTGADLRCDVGDLLDERVVFRAEFGRDYRVLRPLGSGQAMASAQMARGFGRPTIARVRLWNLPSATGAGMATHCPARARDSTAAGESSK